MSHVFVDGDWVPVAEIVKQRGELRAEVERLRPVVDAAIA